MKVVNKKIFSTVLIGILTVCLLAPATAGAAASGSGAPGASINGTGAKRSTTLPRTSTLRHAQGKAVNNHKTNLVRFAVLGENPAITDALVSWFGIRYGVGLTANLNAGKTGTLKIPGCSLPGSKTNWWVEIAHYYGSANGTVSLYRVQ